MCQHVCRLPTAVRPKVCQLVGAGSGSSANSKFNIALIPIHRTWLFIHIDPPPRAKCQRPFGAWVKVILYLVSKSTQATCTCTRCAFFLSSFMGGGVFHTGTAEREPHTRVTALSLSLKPYLYVTFSYRTSSGRVSLV